MPLSRAAGPDDALRVLAMVAHELRSPLAGITGTLATLRQRSQQLTQAEREELLGLAIGQAARLGRLIDLLLRAVAPTTTSPAAGQQVVDAAQLARDAIRLATLAHPTQPFTLAVDVVGALQVRADADAVHGVLANLLDNAARHTPADTQVWVEAARHGRVAVLAVEDAGPGIPTGLRGRIFAPFEQLRPGGQQAGGVGLGLYIARRLARAHGGELLAVDPRRSPHGARFELRLPIAD
jgi:two-component system, OmpR family, sensor kinase